MKKFLSALLAVAILMSMALPVMATENTTEAEILNEEIVTTLTEETVEEQAETEPSLTEATEEVTDAASNDVATVGDDFVFDFDDLLFVGGDIKELTANSVSYYENETPVKPVVTVYYKDGTSGALPDSISVTYPAMPTQPGVYDLELTVASKYAVPFQVTVLPLVPVGPSAKLNAPVIALDYSAFGEDTITWETVEHADKYEIYRATSKTGTFKKIDETEELVWVSETIPVGKTYYYKVVAVYAEDIELNSDESNMVAIDGRCARPELTISVASSGKPALSWKKVTSAKKYEIYRYSADEDVKKVTTTTKTSYTDTSAKSGKTYVYFIIALGSKSAYNSPYSNLVEQMCFLETPQLTVKVDAATGKPLLSWKKIPGAAYYIIGRLLPDGNPEMLDLDNYEFMSLEEEDSRSFLDVSAEPGKEYSYAIGGVNATLTEASYVSELKTVKCTFARPSVDVVVNDNGRPVITWEAVEGADSYIVYRSTKSNKSYKEVKTVTEPSYVDEAASAGTTYYYKVVAVAGETKSAESSYVKATGKCATPELTVSAGSTGKPVLTWNKISGAKKYEIWRSVDGAAFKKLTTVTKTTYTDSKATEGAECTYKVKALGSKSSYNGNFSEVAGCKVTCAAPSLTAKVDTATGKPSLSWSKVTGANGYAIYRSENGGEFALLTTVTGTSYKDEAVAVDNKYSYYVVTVGKSEAFNSIASATKTVEVAVGQPQVKGTVNENGKPVITWDAVEDAVAYKVYRSTKSNKSYKEIATVAELTYVDTSVSTGKTYYYKVVAVGANSSSPESAYVKITGKCA